jgi:ABC-type multidrug transport system ATPase subunit
MEPAAHVLDVVCEFPAPGGRRRVLNGFRLAVGQGRVCGLIGANGSGKSTALRCLAGLVTPTAGVCRVFGRPPSEAAARGRLGFLPELPAFPAGLTGREFLEALARLAGTSRVERRRRVAAALEECGSSAIAEQRLGGLSQGQRARIGLAQAILDEPDLLLLDEPANGLDAEGVAVLGRLLRRWRDRGRSALVTAHDLGQLEAWSDEAALVEEGRIAEVWRRPGDAAAPVWRVSGLQTEQAGRLGDWVREEGGAIETVPAADGWIARVLRPRLANPAGAGEEGGHRRLQGIAEGG